MIRSIATITLIFILMAFNNQATAFDDGDTHPRITKNAVYVAMFENYLIQNLGLKEGLKTVFPYGGNKSVVEWLQKGSSDEDSPNCRASNHFHNPLLSWDQSYMTDQPWWLDVACFDWKPWYSNITWATSYLSPPPDGAKVPFSSSSSYSPITWDKARDYYYKALTLTTQEDRDIYSTWTFQAVGRVLHLLEDMAVPAHTRNDFTSHLIFNGINSLNPIKWYIQPFENYVKMNPQLVATATPSISDFPSIADLRLTDFWDTNLYNGNNPSTLNNVGLSEFTNANYFSDSTIWNNGPSIEHNFSFPKVGITDYQICMGLTPDGSEYRRYISRKTKGNCPSISNANLADHFAAVSLLENENSIIGSDISQLKLWLDDNVHNTYANELLPRAVGYSASLLDYFFRGNIEITIPTNGIYAQTDNSAQGFTSIKFLAKNITPGNEAMTNGSIELVVRYKLAQGDPFQSSPVPTDTEFTYVTVPEFNNANSIPRGSAAVLTFGTGQSTIIPLWATNVYLQVVFKGRLGNEDGAIAVGFKDISEPTPVDVYNNMDKICLNGGWYNTGSPEAIAQVDPDHDGIPGWDIYTHNIENAYLKISNISNPINASPSDYTFYKPLV
ncbi:MAG: hypothetical protein HZB30_10245, partial [Nitrospirae bacterium]|nr:hypothetical protein [Nitrospirota bacterium]